MVFNDNLKQPWQPLGAWGLPCAVAATQGCMLLMCCMAWLCVKYAPHVHVCHVDDQQICAWHKYMNVWVHDTQLLSECAWCVVAINCHYCTALMQ